MSVVRYRLCAKCSEKNQRAIDAFGRSNPGASVDDWAAFFDKNVPWQVKQQLEHCGDGSGPQSIGIAWARELEA